MEKTAAAEWRKVKDRIRNSGFASMSGIICMIITFAVLVQINNSVFLSRDNLMNILKQVVVYGLLSLSLAIPLINGTFDMSVSSIAALSGIISAMFCTTGIAGLKLPMVASMLAAILACCVVGLVNGVIVTYTKVSAFIVTLGTQTAVRGVVYIICGNKPVGNLPDAFKALGFDSLAGIPISVVLMLVVFALTAVLLRRTTFGRKIYANGGNYVAAYQSGIDVKRVRLLTYVISAAIAGVAGILLTARSGSAQPTAASGYESIAISTCAMGGVAMHGGEGSVVGIFLGAIMMGMISNGMNLMKIDSNWQLVVRGAVLVISVLYSQYISRRTANG